MEVLSTSASTREMPFALRASADELVVERVIPRTFQPSERNFSATEPPWKQSG